MAANKPLAIRVGGKFKRASAPKSRTGCLTWCQDDSMKCDGYLPPKPRASKKSKKSKTTESQAVTTANLPLQHFDQTPLLTDPERLYLQHFLHWTAKQLSTSSAATNFWLCYALPMSYQYDAIRYSMIAVGASHRAFMSHSIGFGRPDHLQRPVIQHYNRAISSILPIMSSPTQWNMHCILICCMLFMTCEGLTGHYDELLKHLTAGDMILQSLQDPTMPEESTMTEKVVAMFSQFCLESSDFMKDTLSGIHKWCSKTVKYSTNDIEPFKTLDDASFALHQLRFLHDFAPQNPDRENGKTNDERFEYILSRWGMRFQALAKRSIFNWTDEEMAQFHSLQLFQRYLQMYIDSYDDKEWNNPTNQPLLPFLETAELVAAPLIAMCQPTYSLGGCLVPGLSFAAFATEDDTLRERILNLLAKLDHREGIYDSNDVTEMHALAAIDMGEVVSSCCYDSDDESVYGELDPPLTSPAGIPAMIEGLARKAGVRSNRLECYS
ncbi:hypothetical protein FLAG1_08250 [Fusarium langsethiae]|uniref:Uncharacterized protein n=1 Tax=Fusarium langsethiae TaxID=179993 RepID=A0A0M9ESR3_FUSLA|nr:hypothetical protein FLAG1_08250 [Fusarium langsethiae]GKU06555.1 unnamed protein product [Fusarium langsethiae]